MISIQLVKLQTAQKRLLFGNLFWAVCNFPFASEIFQISRPESFPVFNVKQCLHIFEKNSKIDLKKTNNTVKMNIIGHKMDKLHIMSEGFLVYYNNHQVFLFEK